jgi:glycosyltransferase involved in cell wall biosynthesis
MAIQKVAHVTSVHLPIDTRIFHKECKTLQKAGYQVVLIVPHHADEVIDDVQIRAVPKPKGRMERMVRTVWQVYQAALREKAQVYHFHDPELIPVGLLLKLKGKKVIYDVHEDLPRQILSKEWIPKWLRKGISFAAEILEGLGARFFDKIITVTPTIAVRFPADKTVMVKNFPLVDEWAVDSPMPYAKRPKRVAYVAGGITVHRGLREMVQAMGTLQEELETRLVLAGKISPPALRNESLTGWDRVEEVGFLDRTGVRELLSRVRAGLVTHHPIVNYVDSLPVKMFEYMAAGIPVIASRFPLWREFIEGRECGICVDPLNPLEIANAIEWLMEHPEEARGMGENGRKAVLEMYNWDVEAGKLLSVYKEFSTQMYEFEPMM